MPLLKLETTVPLTEEKRKALLTLLSKAVAEILGKPEEYVMVTAAQTDMMMSGTGADAAFVDIRSIGGLTADVNRRLAQRLCKLLAEALGIPASRIYLNFSDLEANCWGWNGNTFG